MRKHTNPVGTTAFFDGEGGGTNEEDTDAVADGDADREELGVGEGLKETEWLGE